ncbi:hypothetical protein AMTR_s00064p00070470 [Amborella trichopoda]|uniref:Leucine-rich repeat-containing N-terminal plant-type domain-containing protein n=1 Tax=Amborella trichopoda TaxID=13333 RepID=U5DB67_AMBTC|nr:hypothetical protein AMTR_s00064p00070470 [Amborella trichopoda]
MGFTTHGISCHHGKAETAANGKELSAATIPMSSNSTSMLLINPMVQFLGSKTELKTLDPSFARFDSSSTGESHRTPTFGLSEFDGLSVDNLEWLANLSSLQLLKLNGVNLSMVSLDFPRLILEFPLLTEVEAQCCNLSDSIPTPHLPKSTSLRVLTLSVNQLTRVPPWVAHIGSLERLDLGSNDLQHWVPYCLANLRELDLSGSQLIGTLLEPFHVV